MAIFVVSYDLNKNKNYDKIISALEASDSCKVLLSLWLINYNGSVEQLHTELIKLVDEDDSVFICQTPKISIVSFNIANAYEFQEWLDRH